MSSSVEFKEFLILNAISHALLLGILSAIYNAKSTEKDKFQYIYYMSKIMTIKSIILENHYSEMLVDFSNSGKAITFSNTYRSLLKLVKDKNGCITGYKPCGILDTYGNVLCFDELLDCPINSLKIDHINKANLYLAQNYKLASLSNVHEDYKLFFSNNYVKGNVATIIIRTKDEPKFITNNNFILDSEAYKEIFGDQEFLNNIADAFGLRDNEKEKNDKDKLDKIITIFQKIEDTGDDLDYVLKGAKLLYIIINYEYMKIISIHFLKILEIIFILKII